MKYNSDGTISRVLDNAYLTYKCIEEIEVNSVKFFESNFEYTADRLFSERCVNQKSVAGIGCGGTDLNRWPSGYEPDVRPDFCVKLSSLLK